jgi:hypothetical protein
MSFECRYYMNGECTLLNKECQPGQKGCVLNQAKVYFVGQEKPKKEDDKNKLSGSPDSK